MLLKNDIQVKGTGMDPGLHRGDDNPWIPVVTGMTDETAH